MKITRERLIQIIKEELERAPYSYNHAKSAFGAYREAMWIWSNPRSYDPIQRQYDMAYQKFRKNGDASEEITQLIMMIDRAPVPGEIKSEDAREELLDVLRSLSRPTNM